MATAIIIGNGPAGISAALYLKRANIDVTILAKGRGALEKADKIENYYGFAGPISGKELVDAGIANAKRLGCVFVEQEVLSIGYTGKLSVRTKEREYQGDAVILATGAARNTPKIAGIREFEGKGVSYCAVCDAFFYRGKAVAVLGGGEYALHEAMELLPVAGSVTVLTDGAEPAARFPETIRVERRKLARIMGREVVSGVEFAEGGSLPLSGVFVAVGVASSGDLAKKLGAETDGNRIVVNERMETNIPGLYAAGDCIGGLLQIAKAVSDGAIAGTEAIKFLRRG